jgi:hypothetical protein
MRRKKKNRFLRFLELLLVIIAAAAVYRFFETEPEEIRELRQTEIIQTDEEHQEYYFGLLSEEEQRAYREMLSGFISRETGFYLTVSEDEQVERVYHAVLKDHPELFWVQNHGKVYKTVYGASGYCTFSPEYLYTDEEAEEIELAMENALLEVASQISQDAGEYEKVQAVYSYIIDLADYEFCDDDQNIAGIFWRKTAVCAGYARAVQYLLECLGIECIYVDGDAQGSDEGHAWDIVKIDGEYYYVDATNGDQPQFLEGDAVSLAEHKTILYDYLCPFPEEYEQMYTASEEFSVPQCTSTAKNFYVMNQACFDTYDWQSVYDLCILRLDNGAAVVRFKFSNQDAFDQAYTDWIEGDSAQEVARYYLNLYGLREVGYHSGVLDNLKTIYYMF